MHVAVSNFTVIIDSVLWFFLFLDGALNWPIAVIFGLLPSIWVTPVQKESFYASSQK